MWKVIVLLSVAMAVNLEELWARLQNLRDDAGYGGGDGAVLLDQQNVFDQQDNNHVIESAQFESEDTAEWIQVENIDLMNDDDLAKLGRHLVENAEVARQVLAELERHAAQGNINKEFLAEFGHVEEALGAAIRNMGPEMVAFLEAAISEESGSQLDEMSEGDMGDNTLRRLISEGDLDYESEFAREPMEMEWEAEFMKHARSDEDLFSDTMAGNFPFTNIADDDLGDDLPRQSRAAGCVEHTDGVWFLPLDMPGQGRTVASPQGCKQRCQNTSGCKYYNNFPNGGCHITTGVGGTKPGGGNPTKMSGAANCQENSCWSSKMNARYIQQQHGASNECYDFETAKAKCEAASDCHGIATQNNVCGGKYRVTHGSTATILTWGESGAYHNYNLHAFTLNRKCDFAGCKPPSTYKSGGYHCNGYCINGNQGISGLTAAWSKCGDMPECTRIMRYTNGLFYLRKANDHFDANAGFKHVDYICASCVDTANFENGSGHGCASYKSHWCSGGKAKPGSEWTLGARFKFPENNCCVCGKGGDDTPFTIIMFSDLEANYRGHSIAHSYRTVKALKEIGRKNLHYDGKYSSIKVDPELYLFGGDINRDEWAAGFDPKRNLLHTNNGYREVDWEFEDIWNQLYDAGYPTLGVFGNHDWYSPPKAPMNRIQIKNNEKSVLFNRKQMEKAAKLGVTYKTIRPNGNSGPEYYVAEFKGVQIALFGESPMTPSYDVQNGNDHAVPWIQGTDLGNIGSPTVKTVYSNFCTAGASGRCESGAIVGPYQGKFIVKPSDQLERAIKEVDKTKPLVVLQHVPIMDHGASTAKGGTNDYEHLKEPLATQAKFGELFKDYDSNEVAVFTGHTHLELRIGHTIGGTNVTDYTVGYPWHSHWDGNPNWVKSGHGKSPELDRQRKGIWPIYRGYTDLNGKEWTDAGNGLGTAPVPGLAPTSGKQLAFAILMSPKKGFLQVKTIEFEAECWGAGTRCVPTQNCNMCCYHSGNYEFNLEMLFTACGKGPSAEEVAQKKLKEAKRLAAIAAAETKRLAAIAAAETERLAQEAQREAKRVADAAAREAKRIADAAAAAARRYVPNFWSGWGR